MAASEREFGTVTRIIADRGFGFIKAHDGTEYFFHRSDLEGRDDFAGYGVGDSVSFVPKETLKGKRAEEVARA